MSAIPALTRMLRNAAPNASPGYFLLPKNSKPVVLFPKNCSAVCPSMLETLLFLEDIRVLIRSYKKHVL
jgi:hypothetical protein